MQKKRAVGVIAIGSYEIIIGIKYVIEAAIGLHFKSFQELLLMMPLNLPLGILILILGLLTLSLIPLGRVLNIIFAWFSLPLYLASFIGVILSLPVLLSERIPLSSSVIFSCVNTLYLILLLWYLTRPSIKEIFSIKKESIALEKIDNVKDKKRKISMWKLFLIISAAIIGICIMVPLVMFNAAMFQSYTIGPKKAKENGVKIIKLLDEYKIEHGRYPETLEKAGIKAEAEWPDYSYYKEDDVYFLRYQLFMFMSYCYCSNQKEWVLLD